jgi:subtilisin family serine protease
MVESLLRAYEDGNDIITLSFAGISGWTESMSSVIASRIANEGRVVTLAAGNEGEYGSWYTSSPANCLDVISVGSVDKWVQHVSFSGCP